VGQVPSGTEAMRGGDRRSIAIRRVDRRAWLTAAVLALTAMLDDPAVAADEPALAVMKNHQFEPRLLHVRPGQAIRFDNSDDVLHSLQLVGRESVIGEEFVDPGQSYTVRIPQDMPPGTYELACTVHVDMRGQIVVSGK
jgi:plastocyanin